MASGTRGCAVRCHCVVARTRESQVSRLRLPSRSWPPRRPEYPLVDLASSLGFPRRRCVRTSTSGQRYPRAGNVAAGFEIRRDHERTKGKRMRVMSVARQIGDFDRRRPKLAMFLRVDFTASRRSRCRSAHVEGDGRKYCTREGAKVIPGTRRYFEDVSSAFDRCVNMFLRHVHLANALTIPLRTRYAAAGCVSRM